MKTWIKGLILVAALSLAGCSTTFETDRDRVFIFGFGVTFAVVSNKTTKVKTGTKKIKDQEGEEPKSEDSDR